MNKNINGLIIGISGNARSGKNSLYNILERVLKQDYNLETEELSLAHCLKADLNEFCIKNYKISPYSQNTDDKALIRDIMVSHGAIMRKISNGRHWINLLSPIVKESVKEGYIPIVCDIRFYENEMDEVPWIKNELNGILIHVTRYLSGGNKLSGANDSEIRNENKLIDNCNYHLKWPTTEDESLREDCVRLQLGNLFKEIEEKYKYKKCKT